MLAPFPSISPMGLMAAAGIPGSALIRSVAPLGAQGLVPQLVNQGQFITQPQLAMLAMRTQTPFGALQAGAPGNAENHFHSS